MLWLVCPVPRSPDDQNAPFGMWFIPPLYRRVSVSPWVGAATDLQVPRFPFGPPALPPWSTPPRRPRAPPHVSPGGRGRGQGLDDVLQPQLMGHRDTRRRGATPDDDQNHPGAPRVSRRTHVEFQRNSMGQGQCPPAMGPARTERKRIRRVRMMTERCVRSE